MKKLFKKCKNKLQKWRIITGRYLLDYHPKVSSPLQPNDIHSIIFLRQDGKIGDYIVSSFVFREIKKAAPHIKINVVCTKENRELFDNNPHIDTVYIVKAKSMISYWLIGLIIKKHNIDIVIDPTSFIRNRDLVLIRTISASYNIGFNKENYKIFNLNIINYGQHYTEIYREAISLIGISNPDCSYDIPASKSHQQAIQNFLKNNHIHDYIAINFFGAANSRRFTKEKIFKFLEFFNQTIPNTNFILLTYPSVTSTLEEILSRGIKNCFIYKDTVSIQDTIELIRHARIVITPDTATVHIAAGLNKPIIAFYKDDGATCWLPKSGNDTHILYYSDNINEIQPDQILLNWLT
jgi:rfaF protein